MVKERQKDCKSKSKNGIQLFAKVDKAKIFIAPNYCEHSIFYMPKES